MNRTESPLEIKAGEKLATRLAALAGIADINRAGVEACLGLDHQEEPKWAAESVSFAIAQVHLLLQAMNIAAYDLEDAAALREQTAAAD